jgi:hypothetical protein
MNKHEVLNLSRLFTPEHEKYRIKCDESGGVLGNSYVILMRLDLRFIV